LRFGKIILSTTVENIPFIFSTQYGGLVKDQREAITVQRALEIVHEKARNRDCRTFWF
jgi:hypothetical protein